MLKKTSSESTSANDGEAVEEHPLLVAQVVERLKTNYQLHELPTDDSFSVSTFSGALSSPFSSMSAPDSSTRVLVDKALILRIELLEAENKDLKSKLARKTFSVEDVAGNDDLVKLYTGFTTYSVFLAFYDFLGPSVNELASQPSRTTARFFYLSGAVCPGPVYKLQYFICDTRGLARNPGKNTT